MQAKTGGKARVWVTAGLLRDEGLCTPAAMPPPSPERRPTPPSARQPAMATRREPSPPPDRLHQHQPAYSALGVADHRDDHAAGTTRAEPSLVHESVAASMGSQPPAHAAAYATAHAPLEACALRTGRRLRACPPRRARLRQLGALGPQTARRGANHHGRT
eukprot:606798-Prymnesium_polylepis.1